MKKLLIPYLLLFIIFPFFGQTHTSTQPHDGSVTAFATGSNALFSAGNDGFLIKWTASGMGEHFQVSDYEIKMIAVHPNGNEIAVYETDGYSVNRISVWNWATQTRKFAKRISDTVTSLAYSEKGTYIMAGTTSIDGIIFLENTRGSIVKKVNDSAGIVSYAVTSVSENSNCMYSPLGYLIYTNLRTGVRKTEFQVESNLLQPTVYYNDLFFAGVKNDTIHITQATTGTVIAKIPAKSPQICTSRSDSNLYYIENDGKYITLKMIETEEHHVIETPIIVKRFSLANRSTIETLLKRNDSIFFGTTDGNIYSLDTVPSTENVIAQQVTKHVYDKIYDIAAQGDYFFLLTNKSVIRVSYNDSTLVTIAGNTGYTNIIPYDDAVILWSKNTKKPVQYISTDESGFKKTLFTPSQLLQMVHKRGNQLITVESNTTVKMFNFDTNSLTTLYTGTGIQDALLYSPEDLYVAKTATSNPKSALIHVNVTTKETVPLPVTSEVAFSLTENQVENGPFYGVSISTSKDSKKTEIFSYYPQTKMFVPVLQWADEDTQAFTYLQNNMLYTNIGKTQIHAYSISSRQDTLLSRSSSLPVSVAGNSENLLILNKNGSITWYNTKTKKLLKNWYVTNTGEWLEY